MNQMQVFNSPIFGQVRVMEEEGKVLFCGSDVAKALGYARPRDAIRVHCRGAVKRSGVSFTTNQHGKESTQVTEMNFIPEGDVYRLIVRSKLPSAEKFERWVMDEVLPTIRKTGHYDVGAGNSQNELLELVQRTTTAVVGELMKQLMPLLREAMPLQNSSRGTGLADEVKLPKRHHVTLSTIERLDEELRNEVDDMLFSRNCTYREVQQYLASQGVMLSHVSVHNYYKKSVVYIVE